MRAHSTSHHAAADDASPPTRNVAPTLHSSPSTGFPSQPFDASARADQKYTLAFTEEELEAMEDVKLELRRRYDLKTTKVALVRWGLRDLIDDYRQQGELSRLVSRLKAQRTAQNELGETPPPADENHEHSL